MDRQKQVRLKRDVQAPLGFDAVFREAVVESPDFAAAVDRRGFLQVRRLAMETFGELARIAAPRRAAE